MAYQECCAQLAKLAQELEDLATMQHAYILRFQADDLEENPNFKAYQAGVLQFVTNIKNKSRQLGAHINALS